MKFVCIPEPLNLKGLVYSFAAGISYLLDADPEWQRPLSTIRAASRIVDAIENQAPGTWVELRDEDCKKLAETIEAARVPWGVWTATLPDGSEKPYPVSARSFLPFANAISEAQNSLPE